MSGFFTGVIATIMIWIALIFFIDGLNQPSQADIQAKCVGHDGVQQVVGTDWVSIEGIATVVCKDGTVLKVR